MGPLFERAQAGDPAAALEIHNLIRRFARLICRGGGPPGALDTDWEDVAQEASQRFFSTGLRQYRGHGSEASYLYSVVRLTVIQISRRAARRRRRETASIPQDLVTNPVCRVDVLRVLSALSAECRSLLQRVFFAGETCGQIAEELGLAPSSVRSRLSRCVQSARRLTEEGGTS